MAPHAVCAKEECAVSVIPDNSPIWSAYCMLCTKFMYFYFFFPEKAASAKLYNTQSYHQNVSLFRFW